MNIIFMRHGNATDNVKEIISDKEIYWSTLTEEGRKTVLESIETLPSKIDKIYVSPLPRTIETAHLVSQKYKTSDFIIEKRIREINNGKYSGMKNNEDLDRTRKMQIAGDYFIRFGEYGENKYDIELRLCNFLKDVYMNNFPSNTIMIISHGSITSYMKRILKIKTPHIKTGKIEEFINVDFNPLFKHIKKLNDIKLVKLIVDSSVNYIYQIVNTASVVFAFKFCLGFHTILPRLLQIFAGKQGQSLNILLIDVRNDRETDSPGKIRLLVEGFLIFELQLRRQGHQ